MNESELANERGRRGPLLPLALAAAAPVLPLGLGGNSPNAKVGSITSTSNMLFAALMKNDECRECFLTRFGELPAGTLSSANVTLLIDRTAQEIAPEMQRSCERWRFDYNHWEKSVATMRSYAEKETTRVINALVKAFKLSDEERETYFGQALRNEERGVSEPAKSRSMFMTN